jgi:hypothetical protein
MTPDAAPRTIAVRCRRPGRRLSRLRIEYPPWARSGAPLPAYDAAMARQLLAMTGELPASKRGLEIVLAEHRRALHDLISAAGHAPEQVTGR